MEIEGNSSFMKENEDEKLLDSDKREVDKDRRDTDVAISNGDGNEIKFREEETGYNKDKPPEDDCCPICFGEFKVPCKANCGHWFCGNCILQLWKYRSRPRCCKCPFCSSPISKLSPEVSAVNYTENEVVEVLEEIEHYNHFYVKGLEGFFLILAFYIRKHGPFLHLYMWRLLRASFMLLITMPFFIKQVIVDLIIHPERIMLNFQRVRLIACTLSFLLHFSNGLLPQGNLRLQITKVRVCIDCASILLVVLPCMVVICKTWLHIWYLRFRIWQVRREVDVLRAQNAALRAQEEALRAQADALREENTALEENAVLVQQEHAALRVEVDLVKQELVQASLQGKNGPPQQMKTYSTSWPKNEADFGEMEDLQDTYSSDAHTEEEEEEQEDREEEDDEEEEEEEDSSAVVRRGMWDSLQAEKASYFHTRRY